MMTHRVVKEITPAWVCYVVQERTGLFSWNTIQNFNKEDEAIAYCESTGKKEAEYKKRAKEENSSKTIYEYGKPMSEAIEALIGVVIGVLLACLTGGILFMVEN